MHHRAIVSAIYKGVGYDRPTQVLEVVDKDDQIHRYAGISIELGGVIFASDQPSKLIAAEIEGKFPKTVVKLEH